MRGGDALEDRSLRLDGRVAVVTGGGSGIGAAAAKLLAAYGARVAALSRTEDEVRAVSETIGDAGGEAMPLVADVTEADVMAGAVQHILDRWDRLDIVFANAGINGVWAPIEDLTPLEWDRTLNINLRGTFLTIKYATPHLKRRGGSVIVTSSVNGTRVFSNTGATAYASSKAEQVAELVLFLASDASSHITGTEVWIDGGESLLIG